MQSLFFYLKNPHIVVEIILSKTCRFWPDKLYISVLYRNRFHRSLNWDNPMSFNEKLNWEKMYNRNPKYSQMADKWQAKEIVGKLIGEEYIVPSYGMWKSVDDIDWESLPDQFVLKCSHDSGGVIICKDKSNFDIVSAKEKIKRIMKRNWFPHLREWVYKDIVPTIIVDKYLFDNSGTELRDYKFWCFNGKPMYMYFTNKGKNIRENFYDMDFNPVDINHGFDRMKPEFEKIEAFEEMKALASKISKDIPFVRVDFFYVDGRIYFGECTFYDWGGMRPFTNYDWDLKLGRLIDLSMIKNNGKNI